MEQLPPLSLCAQFDDMSRHFEMFVTDHEDVLDGVILLLDSYARRCNKQREQLAALMAENAGLKEQFKRTTEQSSQISRKLRNTQKTLAAEKGKNKQLDSIVKKLRGTLEAVRGVCEQTDISKSSSGKLIYNSIDKVTSEVALNLPAEAETDNSLTDLEYDVSNDDLDEDAVSLNTTIQTIQNMSMCSRQSSNTTLVSNGMRKGDQLDTRSTKSMKLGRPSAWQRVCKILNRSKSNSSVSSHR